MDTLKNIQGVIFDYGGTIDTNSCHWAEVLWTKYMEHQVPVDKESFREAYVFGERALAKYPFVQPWHNFHDVLSIKTKLQVEWLAEQRKLPMDELQLQSYAVKVADSCYGYVLDILQVTRPVVKELAKKYRLVLVSNFYGNIQTILKDFGLLDFFDEIIESSVVGVRKPDPAIYRLGVDAMGFAAENVLVVGDSFSKDVVPAKAVNEGAKAHIILTGKEAVIKGELAKYTYDTSKIEIKNCTEEITCHDAPVQAIRSKKDSSLTVGMNMVKSGDADAIISAGSSGAILAGGQLIVGRSKGVKRSPLAPLIPTTKGYSLLIDCGANVDARPEHLVQFAKMGTVYMENIEKIKKPRVAIVNIGDEEEKGNALVKETYPLLKECKDINFIGSIEAREIPNGAADVIVCEAFVGNVILKLYEGLAKMLLGEIKKAVMSSFKSKIGGALIKGSLGELKERFNAKTKGGAPLLGLKGLVVKIHGNSHNEEVKSAIFQCISFSETGVNAKIADKLSEEQA